MYGYENGDDMIKKCDICGKEYEDNGYYRQFTIICQIPKLPERSNTIKPTLCPDCAWKTSAVVQFVWEFPEFVEEIRHNVFGIGRKDND